jgi:hypothetical protein
VLMVLMIERQPRYYSELILKDNSDAPKTNAVNRDKDSLVFNRLLNGNIRNF